MTILKSFRIVMNQRMNQRDKVLGILGGMGPAATIHFYEMILQETKATVDQEHLHVIIDSNCKIPDRTIFIKENNGKNLLSELKKSVCRLVDSGAELIVLHCVTAHILLQELQKSCSVEILNIITETRKAFQQSGYQRPALLATAGTISARLYQDEFAYFDLMLPEPKQIDDIHTAIMQIKAGNFREAKSVIKKSIASYKKRGADSVLIGCTDIPLVLNNNHSSLPIFNSIKSLAKIVVSKCKQR
jgi:aspartate racemase